MLREFAHYPIYARLIGQVSEGSVLDIDCYDHAGIAVWTKPFIECLCRATVTSSYLEHTLCAENIR